MKTCFAVDGAVYEENKDSFKEVLKRSRLKWSGSRFKGKWTDGKSSVTPVWKTADGGGKGEGYIYIESEDRDVFDAVCLSVKKTLAGKDTDLSMVEDVQKQREESEVDFYARITRPDADYLRRTGCPERWIELSLEDWVKRVEQRRSQQ